jgi:VWFA-related protein
MTRRRLRGGTAVLAALALPAAGTTPAGQEPPPDTPPVFHVSAELVQVDAVVTDKDGRYVADLRVEDFELIEDGKTRPISNFRYVAVMPTPAGAPIAGAAPAPPGPPPALPRTPAGGATMAIVMDDHSLSFESLARTRRRLYELVDDRLAAGELLAVLHTGGGMSNLQQFTGDKRLLRAAIDGVAFNLAGRGGVEAVSIRGDAAADARGDLAPNASGMIHEPLVREQELAAFVRSVMRERQVGLSLSTLTALERVVEGLARLPGRKSMLVFSEGFVLRDSEDASRVEDRLRELTDEANRAGVVIYTIDPAGLRTLLPQAGDSSGGNYDARATRPMRHELRRGLQILAQDTGGLAIEPTNDLNDAMRRVLDDRQGYYLLGYEPDAARYLTRDQKPRFHRIRLRVKRRGLQVRSRRAYYARSQGEVPKTASLVDALLSPLVAADLPLRLTPLWNRDPKKGPVVRCLVHMDARSMTFQEEGDGGSKVELQALAVLFGATGRKGAQGGGGYTLRFRPEAAEAARREGLVLTLDLPAMPGPYQVRAAARDVVSGRTGSAAQFVELPDLQQGRPALSSIVVSGVEAEKPATRQFRGGESVEYAFTIYNARLDAASQPSVGVEMSFYRDGRRIQNLPGPGTAPSVSPDGSVPIGGALRLGAGMKPGVYALAVIVEDRLRRGQDRFAIQWADLEVLAP